MNRTLSTAAAAAIALAAGLPSSAASTATIVGTITSAGKPVPHAVVVAAYNGPALATMADARGRFRITGAPTGHHDVFTFSDGGYIYDHGGYPDLHAGTNDHSRNLIHLGPTKLAPTVSDVTWSATTASPGGTISVSALWKAHDNVGVSDEIFVLVPAFGHVDRFGVGVTKRGKNPDGRYTATLRVPANAKPGTYTAYVFGASEACYTNVNWPTQTIVVR